MILLIIRRLSPTEKYEVDEGVRFWGFSHARVCKVEEKGRHLVRQKACDGVLRTRYPPWNSTLRKNSGTFRKQVRTFRKRSDLPRCASHIRRPSTIKRKLSGKPDTLFVCESLREQALDGSAHKKSVRHVVTDTFV